MDTLLKKILDASGISGYEKEITEIMSAELKSRADEVAVDSFGNVIARKGNGKKKIMIAAHMDEVGLLVKHINKEGFIHFIKIGGVDDRILLGQRVVIKSRKGDVRGIIGHKPPHLVKDEDRKNVIKYTDMFIDIGCSNKDEADQRIAIGDAIVFEPSSGILQGDLYYGKAVDDRVGCYALLKIIERLKVDAQIYAVATVQEEVGLKGARTSSFRINPDFAVAIDTTTAGDIPSIKENESSLKLGKGVAITIMEAGGRGVIVSEKIKNIFVETAVQNTIPFQMDVLEGGMTDGAMIHMNREGIPTGVLSVPARYIHSPVCVFSNEDLNALIELTVRTVEKIVASNMF